MVAEVNGTRRHGIVAEAVKTRKARIKTDFQKDLEKHAEDPQIRALIQARFATFKLGEPVDSLTNMVKNRLEVLKGLNIHSIIR